MNGSPSAELPSASAEAPGGPPRDPRLLELRDRIEADLAALRSHLAATDAAHRHAVEARNAAEQANRQTTEMLAAASHDLLQPLSAARIFLSTLTRLRFRPQSRLMIDRADGALASAEALLTGLLEISAIEAGGIKSEVTSFPISSLLITLRNEFEPLAERKGLSFRVVLSTTRVQSDIRLLRRIIQNLVANAIRYTSHGTVLLGCRRARDGLRVEVWDTGPGIARDKFTRIFEEFERLDAPRDQSDTGIGLGLAIVRRLTGVLDHPLTLRSEVGKGTLFRVTVPYGRAMPALRPDDIAPTVHARNLRGKLILVVENDDRVAEALKGLLKSWACRPITAGSAAQALAKLTEDGGRPDMVLADYRLDDAETGFEAIARVRQEHGRDIPALLITADTRPQLRSEARSNRCEYMRKPIKPPEIRALLSRLLA